jgi:hypothetical protein
LQHAVSLPFFAFMGNDIMKSAAEYSASPSAQLLGITLPISALWLKLLFNCSLQWLCIMFVYRLNSQIDSLSVTLGKSNGP